MNFSDALDYLFSLLYKQESGSNIAGYLRWILIQSETFLKSDDEISKQQIGLDTFIRVHLSLITSHESTIQSPFLALQLFLAAASTNSESINARVDDENGLDYALTLIVISTILSYLSYLRYKKSSLI